MAPFVQMMVIETEIGQVDIVIDKRFEPLFRVIGKEDVGQTGFDDALSPPVLDLRAADRRQEGFDPFRDKKVVGFPLSSVGRPKRIPLTLRLGSRWFRTIGQGTLGGHPCW